MQNDQEESESTTTLQNQEQSVSTATSQMSPPTCSQTVLKDNSEEVLQLYYTEAIESFQMHLATWCCTGVFRRGTPNDLGKGDKLLASPSRD